MTSDRLCVRVLGSSSSIPRPGRACSGYVVQSGSTAVGLDFGTGSFAQFLRHYDPAELQALLISHMHADHFIDLIPLRYALKYGSTQRARPLPLYLPPSGRAMLRSLCAVFASEGGDFLDDVFDVKEYDPARGLQLGELHASFVPARHYIETYAIRLDGTQTSITYSADTAPCLEVVDLARGSDLFLCEATLGTGGEGEPRGHLSAYEAGEMACSAAVSRLMLTHYSSRYQPDDLLTAAGSRYAGPCLLADDGMVAVT